MIDIDNLTEAELVDLNHRIVARIKMMRELKAHQTMLELRIGERVSFQPEDGRVRYGVVVRYNRKSVSVVTDDSGRWTVSPHLLTRVTKSEALTADDLSKDIRLFDQN